MNHELAVGILLGCASAAAANVGVVVEKIAMRRMPPFAVRRTTDMVLRLIRNPFWVIGFCLIAVGLAVQVLALSLASISVIQAVAPTGTVLLLVLSHIFLGDRLRRAEYIGIAALVVALALLVLSLDASSDRATGSTHLSALLAVTIPTACLSLFAFVVASHIGGSAPHRRKMQAPLYGVATGLLYGCAALDMKSISTLLQRWGVVAAVPRILESPTLYLLLATTVLAFLMFQMALQRSLTSVLVPVSSVLSTAYFMVVGDALFHEHLPQAPLSLSLRLASFALLATGLFAVTAVNEAHVAEQPSDVSVLDARSGPPGKAAAESWRRRAEHLSNEALPSGYPGSMRVRVFVFTLVAVCAVVVAIVAVPQVAVIVTAAAIVAVFALTIVSRQRAVLRETAEHLRVAQQNAKDTSSASDRVETLLHAATESAFIGVDPSGMVNFFSAGAEQLFGYSAAEVVGTRSVMDLLGVTQIDERRQKVKILRNGVGLPHAEAPWFPWAVTCKDGQLRRCVIRVRVLPVQAPDLDDALSLSNGGYVIVALNVTEREELLSDRERLYVLQNEVTQSLMEQNDRLRELTRMKETVTTVSPEMGTAITAIQAFVAVLFEAPLELTESQLGMLRTIKRNAENLQRAAEHLMADPAAGRGLRATFSELDLARLAQEAVEAIQTSAGLAGVGVTMEACDERVPIVGDRTWLDQMLWNLLSNAVKFTPRYGRVRVAIDTVGDYARVKFMDEGPGISEDERYELLEHSYHVASSTKTGVPVTCLGLATAKSVAEAHEGFIDIVDTVGWSTTFRVFIPLKSLHRVDPNELTSLGHVAKNPPDRRADATSLGRGVPCRWSLRVGGKVEEVPAVSTTDSQPRDRANHQ